MVTRMVTTWQGMQEMHVLWDGRRAGQLGSTFKKYVLDKTAEEWQSIDGNSPGLPKLIVATR